MDLKILEVQVKVDPKSANFILENSTHGILVRKTKEKHLNFNINIEEN